MTTRPLGFSYFDVIDACAEPGCPICRLSAEVAQRHLSGIIYDSVNDPDTRRRIREAYGFCHEHTWQLRHAGASTPLGVAIIYKDLLTNVNRRLEKAKFQKPGLLTRIQTGLDKLKRTGQAIVKALEPTRPCSACLQRDEMSGIAVSAMMEAITNEDPQMRQGLEDSDGLCLHHLRLSFDIAANQAAFDFLNSVTQAKIDSLNAEMKEFIRKHDFRYRDEKIGEEGDSWLRAMAMMAGPDRTP